MRLAVVLFSLLGVAAADGYACPLTYVEFVAQLPAMKDWPGIYAAFKRNLPACPDDGFFAEGYSQSVVVALARRWSELGQLEKLAQQDADFRQFVIRHVDTTAEDGDLRSVLDSAQTKCPPGAERLCGEIALRAKAAISGPR